MCKMIESFQIHITCLMFLIANNSILSYLLGHYFWIKDLKLDVTGQGSVFIYLVHASEKWASYNTWLPNDIVHKIYKCEHELLFRCWQKRRKLDSLRRRHKTRSYHQLFKMNPFTSFKTILLAWPKKTKNKRFF